MKKTSNLFKKCLLFFKRFWLSIILMLIALGLVAVTVKPIFFPLPKPMTLPLTKLDVPPGAEVLKKEQLNWDPSRIECFSFAEFMAKAVQNPDHPAIIGLYKQGRGIYADYWLPRGDGMFYHFPRQIITIKSSPWCSIIRKFQYKDGMITVTMRKALLSILTLLIIAGMFVCFAKKIYLAARKS